MGKIDFFTLFYLRRENTRKANMSLCSRLIRLLIENAPDWRHVPVNVVHIIIGLIDPISMMMLYLAHYPTCAYDVDFWFRCGPNTTHCHDYCYTHANGLSPAICSSDCSNKTGCKWYYFRNGCAKYGHIDLLRHFVSVLPVVNAAHSSWKGFWFNAALANQVSIMNEFYDIATDHGAKNAESIRKFKWNGEYLLVWLAYHNVPEAFAWLRQHGAAWTGQCGVCALYELPKHGDIRTLQYIRDNYTTCFCGEPAVIAYKGCLQHTKFHPTGIPTAEQTLNYFVDCELWDVFGDLIEEENIQAADFLYDMGYNENQDQVVHLIRRMFRSNPDGVTTVVRWALRRGYTIRTPKLRNIYRIALGGVKTMGNDWEYPVDEDSDLPKLDLGLAQIAHANGCPFPDDLDCSYAVADVNFLRWLHFNVGIHWDERTTAAAAQNPATNDSLKFAISNGCPIAPEVRAALTDREDIAGWLKRFEAASEPAMKRTKTEDA